MPSNLGFRMKTLFKDFLILNRTQRFRADTSGNIAVVFALALLPILAAVGCAVDYTRALCLYTQYSAAADQSIVAAVNKISMGGTASDAKAGAVQMFNALATNITDGTLSSVNVTVDDVGLNRTAVINFNATMKSDFMGMVGIPNVPIKGSATAQSSFPTYIDFYLLLDNTPSMGVGATPADVALMVNNTSDKCAFACHDVSDSNNYYKKAKSLGVTTRIDVVRTATQSLMDTAAATATLPNQFRMAVYTFGDSAATAGLTTIAPLTSNLSTAKSNAAGIDLMTVKGQGQFDDTDTNYDLIIPSLNLAIPSPGDGTTSAQPQKIVFFVSDGVADEFNSANCSQSTLNGDGRCQEPINVALCTAIKNRGIKIAVLYTTYLPLPTNSWYMSTVDPWASQIPANMQNCASAGLYFEVSPTQGISDAMNALFQRAVASARLTR